MNLSEYLNTPIPRKHALLLVGVATANTACIYVTAMNLLKRSNFIIGDQAERIRIYDESVKFLLENADGRTLAELDDKLDFWRIIREVPKTTEEGDAS